MKVKATCVSSVFVLLFGLLSAQSQAQLKTKFTSNIQSGCSPLVVSFQDQSSGNPTSWKWDLGNGTISTDQNPVTTYFKPGTYTIKLSVKNNSGLDSVKQIAYVTVYFNPQADFNASPTQGCYPLDVKFTNNSKAGSGIITNYLWDYGDGNVDTVQKPDHIYLSAGTFDLTLKVTNSYGCSSSIIKNDLVHIDDGVVAGFSLTSLDVCKLPATAVFDNTSNGPEATTYLWSFGDGNTSSSASPSHNYTNSGAYNVLLTAETLGGCSDTQSLKINVSVPVSSFKNSDATCSNQSISFTNTSSPSPLSSTWYFGDGTSSSHVNPTKTYTKTGTYTVKLVNVFAAGCSDSVTKTITIAAGPAVSFKADDTLKCTAPLDVHFTNSSSGATQYSWDFGDGTTSASANPDHTYTAMGNYTVTLTATNANNCGTSFQKINYISIQPIKITRLSNLPDSGCIPLTIKTQLSSTATTSIKSYSWDFGDGGTSTDSTPSHTYTKEGIYAVTVSIITVDGCTATYTLKNAVLAGHKPTASFTPAHDTICANAGVNFQSTSTNGPITFLRWDFGVIQDAVSGQDYYYQPSDTGFHTISLVAYNYGCADTINQIHAVYALAPIARMLVKLNCDNKTQVNFIDTSKSDLQNIWDFGDSTTSTVKDPVHNYATPGSYTVHLYVQNNACRDTTTNIVHVINEKGTLTLPGKVICRGNNMNADIAGINVGNVKSTRWDFGDGTIITVNGATKGTHVYTTAGNFKVTATMTDLNGCQYIFTQDSITVYGPLANFYSAQPNACLNGAVNFVDKSLSDGIHNIIKWSWSYGDSVYEDYNTATAISHIYTDSGRYSVRLTATDSYGCSDSIRRPSYVYISHPLASFSVSDSIMCPGGNISFKNASAGNGLSYAWHFGDGSQSTQTNPSYGYKAAGVYTSSLTVTDVFGCTDTSISKPITVAPPSAKFIMSDSFSTCPPLQVNFTNNSQAFSAVNWAFGDGSSSVLGSPSHLYTYPGVYQAKLTLKGFGSCTDTLIKKIIIKGPTGKLVYDATPRCAPGLTEITVKQPSHTQNFTWDFSDGTTVITTKNDTSHTYQAGSFVPKLILTDSLGCKVAITGTDTINVYDITANATTSTTAGCDSASVKFTDVSSSNDNIISHYWNFGDSLNGSGATIFHNYGKIGNYSAYLISVTKHNCRDTFYIPTPITISTAPRIQILGDSVACAFTTVNFKAKNNVADTSAIQWVWNFSNGNSAVGTAASTSYNTAGSYIISLTAKNAGGCTDTTNKKIKINTPPIVNAGPDTTVCQNSPHQLNASGALSYSWQGPGLSCTNCISPTVTVDSVATYIVTGKDNIGCVGFDSVRLKAILPMPIKVSGGDTLCVGQKTQFVASGAYQYKWFPSAYLNDDKSPNPIFTASTDTAINYKVVGYTQKNCFTDTASVFVKAFPIPQMKIQSNNITLAVGSSVQLVSNSSADVNQWQWSPATGLNSSVVANPIASPRQTTTYSVIASNGGGCVARDQITVNVICGNTNMFIPNTFSPNGDGVNDIFYARGNGLFNVKSLRIFNRWGQLVFEKYGGIPNNASDGWNGLYNGKPLNSDVYVYMMEILCENGNVVPIKGNVTLLR